MHKHIQPQLHDFDLIYRHIILEHDEQGELFITFERSHFLESDSEAARD